MPEDTTQEVVAEAPTGQAETTEVQGVEDTEVAQVGTDESLQSPEELEKEAEVSMFDTLSKSKGWKDPEDMAKAYREAEGELTRRSQALSKTQEDYAAMEAVLEGIINGEITPDAIAEDEPYRPQNDNFDRTRKLEARLDVRTIAERHKDFTEIQPIMSQILKEVPNKTVFEGEKGVELLYKMAKAEKMDAELANAKAEGAKSVTLAEVEKVRAGVADGTKAKQPGRKVYTAQEIGSMPHEVYLENRDEIMQQYSEGLIK
jgi:hypothetical protein